MQSMLHIYIDQRLVEVCPSLKTLSAIGTLISSSSLKSVLQLPSMAEILALDTIPLQRRSNSGTASHGKVFFFADSLSALHARVSGQVSVTAALYTTDKGQYQHIPLWVNYRGLLYRCTAVDPFQADRHLRKCQNERADRLAKDQAATAERAASYKTYISNRLLGGVYVRCIHRMPLRWSYRKRLRSLLLWACVPAMSGVTSIVRAQLLPIVCSFYSSALGLILFQITYKRGLIPRSQNAAA